MNDAQSNNTTITTTRKSILRKQWSNYLKTYHASAADHACYFALLAAMSQPENQQACLHGKMTAAFRPATNAKKLANGHQFYQNKYYYNGIQTPLRWLSFIGKEKEIGRFKEFVKTTYGFLYHAYEFLQLEELRTAEALLQKEVR